MDSQKPERSSTPAPVWMVPVFIAIGLGIIAAAVGLIHLDPHDLQAPRWVLGCCGGLFFLVGLLIASQSNQSSLWGKLLIASFFTLFAVVFGWVGFGPGGRAFSMTTVVAGIASHSGSGETSGRIVFATIAVIVGCVAAAAWWKLTRVLSGTSHSEN